MRRLVAGAALCVGLVLPATATATSYLAVYRDGVSDAGLLTSQLQTTLGFTATDVYASALKGFAANLSSAQLTALESNPNIAFTELSKQQAATGMITLAAGESAPPGIRRIGAATTTQAHQAANAAVAVLDTGADLTNANLLVSSGTNCISPGSTAQDDNGHGTHVAGTIAGRNTGSGLVGAAPGTRTYAVKVLNSRLTGTTAQIVCGIDWVAANAAALNIKVVNMSVAGSGVNDGNCGNSNGDSEHKAICGAIAKGVNFVVAAGNNAKAIGGYIPAAYPEVLTVTAMSDTDGLAGAKGAAPSCKSGEKDDSYGTYSNFASTATEQAHTISAPGTCVLSDKIGGGTATYYGSSQASPHAAAAVALCLGSGGANGPCTGMTPPQVVSKLRSDAAAGATTATGFTGDPLTPVNGKYFGYLVRAGGY